MAENEIRRIGSKVVYRNRWMTVREDQIRREQAGPGVYGVVEKPDFAVIAAIEDRHIHLVEQYRYPVEGRFWELPQGSWDQAVDNAAALAAGELREETGLTAESIVHVGHLFVAYGYSNQGYNVFVATDLTQHTPQRDAEEEGLLARAFPTAEFEQMILDGVIKDATTVATHGLLKLKGLL